MMERVIENNSPKPPTVYLVDANEVSDAEIISKLAYLSPAEINRYQRFIRPLRQRQFVIGHVLLRYALAKLLHLSMSDIVLTEKPSQAPILDLPDVTFKPSFSISHSGNWIACAVSSSTKVGLDIELLDPTRNLHALSQHIFTQEENARFALLPEQAKLRAFYELWSAREARYKLTQSFDGTGHCYALAHPAISIVLCTNDELAELPSIEMVG